MKKILLFFLTLMFVPGFSGCQRRIVPLEEIPNTGPATVQKEDLPEETKREEEIDGLILEAEGAEDEFNRELKGFDYLDSLEDNLELQL